MNFSENTNLMPGGQSASPSKIKELNNRIDDLQQTVTNVADSVAGLSNEVTTAELNATSANVTNAVIDNATVGTETATTVNATTANADTLNATDGSVTNLTSDDIEANSVDADNGYFGSVNAQSFTGQGINITGDITASNKVQGKTVQATEKIVTPALESTTTELKGATTVRGDVHFPENGDKIYGEYLEVEANKVKIKNLTTETPTDTNQIVGYDANGNLIPVDAFLNPVSLWEPRSSDTIQPKNSKKIEATEITTPKLNADDVNVTDDLSVGGDATVTGTLFVTDDATLDGNLTVNNDTYLKGEAYLKNTEVNGTLSVTDDATITGELTVNGSATLRDTSLYSADISNDLRVRDNATLDGKLTVGGELSCQSISATAAIRTQGNLSANGDLIISGDVGVIGDTTLADTTLADTEVNGTLTVNGNIVQNGSAYETHAEKLYTKKDIIITRDGAVSALGADEYTGLQATKYDGTNDGQLVFDKDGEARVGDVGDTQPLLTRDEVADMTDGSLLKWDGTNKKAVCGTAAQTNAVNSGITSTLVTKLNGIATGAEVNVQADWSTTDTSADSYIKNKPAIPTVNNGTLTIQKNGTNVQTFTANQNSNATANITVPTKTSDLTNDSNFVADVSYVHTDNNFTSTLKTKLNGIATGAEVNVQADWAQTDSTKDDYIKNKPTIPTTWGTAAEKNAGNANGYVPLLAGALTSGNLVQMGSGGLVNSYGVEDFREMSNGGAVCSTAKATTAKEIILPGITSLYTGMTVKVMFTNGNSAASPTLRVKQSSGVTIGTYSIKVVKAGSKVVPTNKTGHWRGATSTSSEMWQPYTTLELMYDGTNFVIMGNPVVENYGGAGFGYEVKADGQVTQWDTTSVTQDTATTINYLISFNQGPTVVATPVPASQDRYQRYMFQIYSISTTGFYGYINTSKTPANITWIAKGY